MKRIFTVLLAALMLLSLAACAGDTAAPAPTAEPISEPATEPATEPPTESPVNRYIDYCGRWQSTTQFHYMELYIEGGVLYLDYTCFSANANRIAEAMASVSLSDIQNNQATFYYSDDGWGNRGSITLDFSQPDKIGCTTVTTYRESSAQWSIVEATLTFARTN